MMSPMTDEQRKFVWMATIAVVGAALVFGARVWGAAQPPAVTPVVADTPTGRLVDFACVDRSGKAMRTADLKGKYVLADFVFTSCSAMCPSLAKEMKSVQDSEAGRGLAFASFSVDPARDSLPVMAKYADEHGFDPNRWLFLRSDLPDLKKLMCDELHLAETTDIILHTDRFVLFAPDGAACAIYRPLDDRTWRTKLASDLARLRPTPH
jgi:protein SCO1/2